MKEQHKNYIKERLNALKSFVETTTDAIMEADPTLLGRKGADLIISRIEQDINYILALIEIDP